MRLRTKAGLCGLSHVNVAAYRIPLQVTEVIVFAKDGMYPVCPRCDCTLDREYMGFCDRCGQRLGWEKFDSEKTVRSVNYR